MTAPIPKRADQLAVGDHIPDEHLPYRFHKGPAEVRFVDNDGDDTHIFIAYRYPNGRYESHALPSEAKLEVYPAPDPTGLSYSRADDGETTQPIAGRVPPHFEDGRAVVEVAGGLVEVDPPEGFVAASAPVRSCPAHGPHPHLSAGGACLDCPQCRPPIARHYDASEFAGDAICACGESFGGLGALDRLSSHIALTNAEPS